MKVILWSSQTKEEKDDEDNLIKQAKNTRRPIPEFIIERYRNKPSLGVGLDFYLKAFFDLNTERDHSNGYPPIPWSKIQMYADHYEMNFDDTEKFHLVMRSLDNAYCEKKNEDAKNKLEQK